MSRSKKAASPQQEPVEIKQGKWWLAQDAPWGGFINVRVDDEQKADYEVWLGEHPNECWVMLEDLLGEGMKVGFAYDRENECFILTFTGALVKGSTERYCLTTRAGTFGDVVALATWKHFQLLKEEYGSLKANGRKMSWG